MTQKKGARAKKLFSILLLSGGAFFFWKIIVQELLFDQTRLSGMLESEVNAVLVRHQIDDTHILHAVRTQRQTFFPLPALWIETEREIALPSNRLLPSLISELKETASRLKFKFLSTHEKTSPSNRIRLELVRKDRVFQKIFFLEPEKKSRENKLSVAIVIDDVAGRPSDLKKLEHFFSLGIPVTYAILPMEKISSQAAHKIHQSGGEIILHQPLEPGNLTENDPGKAVILLSMNHEEIEQKLKENFESVPHAVGLSNHMGSRFTTSPQGMRALMDSLKKAAAPRSNRPFYFFDSYTNAKSVGETSAKNAAVHYLRNDLFLDNEDDPQLIKKQLDTLKIKVKKKGSVVAIGHIQREHLIDVLKSALPEFSREGIEFVHLSKLMPKNTHPIHNKIKKKLHARTGN